MRTKNRRTHSPIDSLPGFAEKATIDPLYFFAIDLMNKTMASIDCEYPSREW
jgi:hypothetical protein